MQLGTFSGRTILTGAGWTRNWGGKVAAELWQDLVGHPKVQRNRKLTELLRNELWFENALATVRTDGAFSASDIQVLEGAIVDAFTAMDRAIAAPRHDVNIYAVQELLFQLWGPLKQPSKTAYMFTLNQDIWPERNMYNGHVYGAPDPSLPGLQLQPNQRFFQPDLWLTANDLTAHPMSRPHTDELVGRFNVVKLHGSFNWRTKEGQNALVVGADKSAQISASPLLGWYWDIFRSVIMHGNVILLIVGYGFGDAHVNAAIAEAVENHGLKFFIWDTNPPLEGKVGSSIWKGLLSTATRPMSEVFPVGQDVTVEFERIRDTVFR